MTVPQVMVIGDINIDAVIAASEYPPEGGEAVVERADFRLGGSGCNTSVVLAKMGIRTLHVGNLGTEPLGQMAMNYIHSAGIDTDLLQQKEEFQTGFFFILITAGGQRTMFGGRACNAFPPDFDQIAPHISFINSLHISGYTLIQDKQFEVILKLAKIARQQGKIISLDPGICTTKTAKAKVNAILPSIDYLLISQQELMDYSKPESVDTGIKTLLKSGIKALVLKKGAAGSQYIDRNQRISQPAFHSEKHPIQDTTGAGDCFDAGFMVASLNGLDLPGCLTLGSLTAYRTIIAPHGVADICQIKNYAQDLGNLLEEFHLPADQCKPLSELLKSLKSVG
jgi:sugar/nucleoside kinase (ribokinase family)